MFPARFATQFVAQRPKSREGRPAFFGICRGCGHRHQSQKGGVDPSALPGLLEASTHWSRLRITGLMSVPAATADPEDSRPAFARLRALRDEHRGEPGGEHLSELSMGMTGDFEIAIEEGATIVRVGTAIFGPRSET